MTLTILKHPSRSQKMMLLRQSYTVFPGYQDSYDLNGFHHPYDLGRLIEPPWSHDFKVALYVCPNCMDDGILSHHSHLWTLEKRITPP